MARSPKPATSISEQIALLRDRGMYLDEEFAAQWLSNVSYYRLSAYWYPARLQGDQGTRSDVFVEGTSFTDATDLYEADRKLRTLIHDGMERVEITMRTRIGALLCVDDPLRYTHPDRFRPTFGHSAWISTAQKRIARAERHNEAIRHHRDDYGARYPFWVLAEVLDFSDVSRLLEGLPARDQQEIAEGLGIALDLTSLSPAQRRKAKTTSPLVRWMEQLTIVRNTCAHHGRLWNKSFAPAPTAALRTHRSFDLLPEGQSERIFGVLVLMSHILRVTSPGTAWPDRAADLICREFLTNPLVSTAALGLPTTWDGSL